MNDPLWEEASFRNQKELDEHIADHLHEYGGISAREYVEEARKLLSADLDDDIDGFVDEDGFVFKYRKSTKDFAIGHFCGSISTLFKPKNGEEYWNEQRKEYCR